MAARRLQAADNLLAPAVAAAIGALTLDNADTGAVKLARAYAEAIDAAPGDPEVLEKLGPKLLAALESLGATPKARATITKGTAGAAAGRLAALRAARRPA